MSPWERPFPAVLGWGQVPCRAELCLHSNLPLPAWTVGTLLHPCVPEPPLQRGLQAEHTQVFDGKARSPLPSLFLKWFNLTQIKTAGVMSQPSPPLPSCRLWAQITGSDTVNCRTPNPLKSHQKMGSKKFTYKFHREFPISISSFPAYHWHNSDQYG